MEFIPDKTYPEILKVRQGLFTAPAFFCLEENAKVRI